MTRIFIFTLALAAFACGDKRIPCDAQTPCPDPMVCVWDAKDQKAVCANPCGACEINEVCNVCMASGECPICKMCVAACWPVGN